MRRLVLLLIAVLTATSLRAAPQDVIPTIASKPVSDWRRIVVDHGLLGDYYTVANGPPVWIADGKPNKRAAELVAAIKAVAAGYVYLQSRPAGV